MTLACIPCKSRQATPKIGRKKVKASSTKASALPPNHCPELGVEVVGKFTQKTQLRRVVCHINWLQFTHIFTGAVFWWEDCNLAIMPLSSLATSSSKVSLDRRLSFLKTLLTSRRKIVAFDSSRLTKICHSLLKGFLVDGDKVEFRDPRIALWMLQPGEEEAKLGDIVMR